MNLPAKKYPTQLLLPWTPCGEDLMGVPHAVSLPDVVAFTGIAGCGKSTAAQFLVDRYGYERLRFAGPLKAAMAVLGLSQAEIEGELKEAPSEALCGKSPRHAMQTLGTEWGRRCIGDDFWVRLWLRKADDIIAKGGRVVVDDCRFPNEAAAIRKLGGDIFRICGRGGIAGDHVSEHGCGDEDLVIANTEDIAWLHGKINEALLRFS
jgi:hypothetical protein